MTAIAVEPQRRLAELLFASAVINNFSDATPAEDEMVIDKRQKSEGKSTGSLRVVAAAASARDGESAFLTGTGDRWGGARIIESDGLLHSHASPVPTISIDAEVRF